MVNVLTRENGDENKLDVNCGICQIIVEEDNEGLYCDVCNSWFHNDCNKTPLDYELYVLLNEAPKNVKWFCDKCIWKIEKWIKDVNNKQYKTSMNNDKLHEDHNKDSRPTISEIKIDIDNENLENENLEAEEINDSLDLNEFDSTEDKEEVIKITHKKKPRIEIISDSIRASSETSVKENILNLLNISPEKLSNITDEIRSVKKTKPTNKYIRSKCNLCPKTFLHLEDCIAHNLSDHGGVQKPYKCSVCKKVWETKRARERHMSVHFGLNKYRYKAIENTLKNKDSLQKHLGILTRHKSSLQSSEVLQCKEKQIPDIDESKYAIKETNVSQGFLHSLQNYGDEFDESWEENYAESVEANESNKSDEDYIDGGSESADSNYSGGSEYNMNSCKKYQDTVEKSYQCSHCDRKFTQNSGLKMHMVIHSDEKPYQCSYCDKAFKLKGTLKSHVSTHTGEKRYQCNMCDKSFKQIGYLPEHMRTHTGERPYLCNHCGKAFKQNSLFKRHLKIHTGEKPYACNHCDKAFTQNGQLRKHLKIHSGEKSYLCNQCGKAFTENNGLMRHLKVHTGEKPYPCNFCDNTFRRSDQLISHLRIHTGETPYKCIQCGKGYSHNCQLKTHLRTHTEGKT
ncbi:unnamed protein product [Meganyctiphanes norvegica]|uniref:Uncharacterized protein n=1 Tax=Meganyctiphanes norvegica TaxID=48144 RepID=A0AAV2SSR9_MEGNR